MRIQVRTTTGQTLSGNIDHVTAEAVHLLIKTQTIEIRRNKIRRLYLKKERNWIRPVLIGAGIGAAAAGIAAPRTLEHETGYGGAVAGTVLFGALVGAGVGRLVSGSGYSLVYETRALIISTAKITPCNSRRARCPERS